MQAYSYLRLFHTWVMNPIMHMVDRIRSAWPSEIYLDSECFNYHVIKGYDSTIQETVTYVLSPSHLSNALGRPVDQRWVFSAKGLLYLIRHYIENTESNGAIGVLYDEKLVDIPESFRRCLRIKNNINFADLPHILDTHLHPHPNKIEVLFSDMTVQVFNPSSLPHAPESSDCKTDTAVGNK